jgi:hypothetical protein
MTESEKRIPPFGLRLPPDLKERVQAVAKANNRSMNAEIVARLSESFTGSGQITPATVTALENATEALVRLLDQYPPEAIRRLVEKGLES